MKFAVLFLLFTQVVSAECFQQKLSPGDIDPGRRENLLVLQKADRIGDESWLGVAGSNGQFEVTTDLGCEGGAPQLCRIGQDGARGFLVEKENTVKIILRKAQLQAVSESGEDDLKALPGLHDRSYLLEATNSMVCQKLFPQPEVERGNRRPPTIIMRPDVRTGS